MALKPLFGKNLPYGQFDGLDSQVTSSLGGEVCTFTYVALATDTHAADVEDGYMAAANTRAAVTSTLTTGARPLFLCDEGTSGYGTIFGSLVGATVGQIVTGGAVLGPHTAAGSGKVTLWDAHGMYGITLDAVDTTVNSGLVPTNPALVGGDAIYATAAGLLTPDAGSAFEAVVLGRFIEFAPNGNLVTSSLGQIQGLNSPTGSSAPGAQFDMAVIHWAPELS